MKDNVKRYLETFLTAHVLISLVIGISGLLVGREHELQYWEMFTPTVLALVCALPVLLTFHPERLSITQLIRRRILQIIIGEVMILTFVATGRHGIHTWAQLIVVALTVPVVVAGLCFFDWLLNYLEARELNRCLKEMQKNLSKEDK
ncbi:MAG: hypothetical protein J6K89_02860 [Oscillospiraceae bacterium]|nr:hypothetical protein [Oscillospiraceae bacterium]